MSLLISTERKNSLSEKSDVSADSSNGFTRAHPAGANLNEKQALEEPKPCNFEVLHLPLMRLLMFETLRSAAG